MAGSTQRPIDMETERLIVRHLSPEDEAAFLSGIGDRELRRMYGLPLELSEERARQIFQRFSALPAAYGLIRKADDALIGFLLDVPSELPEDMQRALPVGGRTLAYATFPPYQRQGYSMVLKEELLTPESLLRSLKELYRDRDQYIEAMSKSSQSAAIDVIMELITSVHK